MNTDQILRIILGVEEGERLEAYPDSRGYWTIGRGHLISEEHWLEMIRQGNKPRITPEEMERLYTHDTRAARAGYIRLFAGCEINAARQAVLTSIIYQVGEGDMRLMCYPPGIAIIDHIKGGDWQGVVTELARAKAAKQTPERWIRQGQVLIAGTIEGVYV